MARARPSATPPIVRSMSRSPSRRGTRRSRYTVEHLWDLRRGELWAKTEEHFHTRALREKTLADHEAIVTALAAHDARGARDAMHRHLSRVAQEFQRRIGRPARARSGGARRCTPAWQGQGATRLRIGHSTGSRRQRGRDRATKRTVRMQSNAIWRRKTMKSRSLEGRRALLHAALGAAVAALFTGAVPAGAQVPAMPKSPVTINIVDVAGNLALTQDAIEHYAKKHPELVAKFNFTKAPAPELPGQAQGDAGRGPQRHRPRADRHRLSRRRHRAGRARSSSLPDVRREVSRT